MDNKETVKGLFATNSFIYNEDYFKYIFKKTEKIVSAVFYVTRSINDNSQKDSVIVAIEDKAYQLLETVGKTLSGGMSTQSLRLEELKVKLVMLESVLTLGNGARLIPHDLLEVFRHEIKSVERSLRDYVDGYGGQVLSSLLTTPEPVRERREYARKAQSAPVAQGQVSGGGSALDRRTRILEIIKDKKDASIKDISTVISDCSEKTIQRELMSLISEGVISKTGERRWSRYSIIGVYV